MGVMIAVIMIASHKFVLESNTVMSTIVSVTVNCLYVF